MKQIFILAFISLLMLGSAMAVDVSAPMPYPVYGTVTIAGERADLLTVQILNVKTGEIIEHITEQGDFVMDFSEFKKGWSANNEYKVTYCSNDIRCNSLTESFTLEGDSKELNKDLISTGIYCSAGQTKSEDCPDGSVIAVADCIDGKWETTGNKCPVIEPPVTVCTEGDTKYTTCDDGTRLLSSVCLNNAWEEYETNCPNVPPQPTDWTLIAVILGIFAVIIIGLVIYFVSKR